MNIVQTCGTYTTSNIFIFGEFSKTLYLIEKFKAHLKRT